MVRWASALAGCLGLAMVIVLPAQAKARAPSQAVPDLPVAPDGPPPHVSDGITDTYRSVLSSGQRLSADVARYRARCSRVLKSDGKAVRDCEVARVDIELAWVRYEVELADYQKQLAALKTKFPLPRYLLSGRGLVLGLTSIGGFNVPPSLSAAAAAQVRSTLAARLSDAQNRAGVPPEQHVHTEGYNFILGLASAPVLGDLELMRAHMDSRTNGDYSRLNREVYPSLKGRYFETLECHSNGAMVCLAALRVGDVAARAVRLLGPQVTPDSLAAWEALIEQGYVNRVTLYWMTLDPIPFLSLAADTNRRPPPQAVATTALKNRVGELAPALGIGVFLCPVVALREYGVACHNVRLYQEALAATP